MSGFDLDRVRVGTPCPMKWEELQGDERRRYCDHCSLSVFNLSALPRAEAQALLAERATEGRLCVTFQRRADGTVVTREPAPPAAVQAGRWARALGAAASLLFGLFPFLAACRPSEGPARPPANPPANGVEGGSGSCTPTSALGGVEILGEVALPAPAPTGEEPAPPDRIVGKVSAEEPRELGDAAFED